MAFCLTLKHTKTDFYLNRIYQNNFQKDQPKVRPIIHAIYKKSKSLMTIKSIHPS